MSERVPSDPLTGVRTPCNDPRMNTQTAAAAQTDENLMTMIFLFGGRPLRDGEGNLRDITADEEAFGKALRTEAKARGLL